jgi:translation initiation factor IF-2
LGVRVYILAKELNMSSKDLVAYLHTQGVQVKGHMATVDDNVARILRDRYKPKTPPPPPSDAGNRGGLRGSTATGAARPRTGSEVGRTSVTGSTGSRVTYTPGSTGGSTGPGGVGRAREPQRYTPGSRPPARIGGVARPSGGSTFGADAKPEGRGGEGREGKAWDKGKGPRKVRYFPQQDNRQDSRSGTGARRRNDPPRRVMPGPRGSAALASEALPDKVEIAHPVTVKDLSSALGIKGAVLVKKLFDKGRVVTINQYLDEETILELSVDLGVEIVVRKKEEALEDAVRTIQDAENLPEDMVLRAPVVTFMGHVDHGKTSLLDRIRTTNVTSRESGGITQHLGAYRVDKGNVHVTFIDTPGHKAFTEMRARGANVTDLAVLVVAADDGPKPQTEEAINHAKAAGVPIIVALNKIDLPTANPQRCKEALAAYDLLPVEWNGKTEYIEVSALTGQGIETLLETLSLESEILHLRANPKRPALGVVLEVEATSQRGVIATVLVQDGTLKVGDYVLCGATHGRVRNLILNGSEQITSAGPSYPVQVVGLNSVPGIGDRFYVFQDERKAREVAADRATRQREADRAVRQAITLENFLSHIESGTNQELRLIIKADVRGSIEGLKKALEQVSNEEVRLNILHTGVGAINQEDIQLAVASQAIVVGFHVSADDRARALADDRGVDIRYYDIIYDVVDDVKSALRAKLAPEFAEEIHGRAEIRQVYKASKLGNIAGCYVTSGFIRRSDKVRLVRDGRVVHTGDISSLRRFQDDAREVKEDYECGIKISNYDDIKAGDIIESYAVVEKQRSL